MNLHSDDRPVARATEYSPELERDPKAPLGAGPADDFHGRPEGAGRAEGPEPEPEPEPEHVPEPEIRPELEPKTEDGRRARLESRDWPVMEQYAKFVGEVPTTGTIAKFDATNGPLKELLNLYESSRVQIMSGAKSPVLFDSAATRALKLIKMELDMIDRPSYDATPEEIQYSEGIRELGWRIQKDVNEVHSESEMPSGRCKLAGLGKSVKKATLEDAEKYGIKSWSKGVRPGQKGLAKWWSDRYNSNAIQNSVRQSLGSNYSKFEDVIENWEKAWDNKLADRKKLIARTRELANRIQDLKTFLTSFVTQDHPSVVEVDNLLNAIATRAAEELAFG